MSPPDPFGDFSIFVSFAFELWRYLFVMTNSVGVISQTVSQRLMDRASSNYEFFHSTTASRQCGV